DGLGGADRPQTDRDQGRGPGGTVAVAEPREGDAVPASPALPAGTRRSAGEGGGRASCAAGDRGALGEEPHVQLPRWSGHRPSDQAHVAPAAGRARRRRGAGRLRRPAPRRRASGPAGGGRGLTPMRPAEVVDRGADYLERHGVDAPRVNAEELMMRILGVDRTGLFMRSDGLTSAEAPGYGRALCRRCTGTPLQHLTGEQGFRRLVLAMRPGVFIPRPETEILVDAGLGAIEGIEAPVVVDLCTGSGAVALAIADEHSGARV